MVLILQNEALEETADRSVRILKEAHHFASTLKDEREKRKIAAIERSRIRQEDESYFNSRKSANESFPKNHIISPLDTNKDETVDVYDQNNTSDEKKGESKHVDPFAPKWRSRIGGKSFV